MAQKETRIMKKPVIILVSAVVLAGGSVGAFLAVKNKSDKEASIAQSQKEDNILFSFNGDSVRQLEFDIDGDTYIAEKGDEEGSVWELSNRDDFALDQVYMQLICTYTSSLTAQNCYGTADDSKKAMYGLDTPTVIKITDDIRTYDLYIGDESPTGQQFYVMTGDKDKIYAIDSYKGTSLVPSRLTLKTKMLVPYNNSQISDIIIKPKGKEEFKLTYDQESQLWGMDKKYDMLTTDRTAISSMVANLVRLEAEDLLDENLADLDHYGFDDPDCEVIVNGIDGTQRSFRIKTNEEDPSFSYVLINEDKQVETYYTSYLTFADTSPYDYIIQTVKGADMYNIKGFDIEMDGETTEFTIDTDTRVCTINGKEVDISNSEGYTLFQNFYDSFSMMSVEGLDTGAKPDDSEPSLNVVYHNNDGTDSTISITEEDGKFYIFKDGKYTGAYAPAERFSGRTSIGEFFKKLKAYSI